MTKALLVRNHPDIKRWVDRLFSMFPDPQIGWDAAKALGSLGSGGESVLTKTNHAVLGVRCTEVGFCSLRLIQFG